jgi:hypothetical protein
MVQVGNHKVSVEADASAYSLRTSNAGSIASVAPGKTLTVGTDAAVAAGKLIAQISGASAGELVVGGKLDLTSASDVLGLDWVPAGAASKFGGVYEIAQYGSLDGTFSAINGGNICSAYVSGIDYLTGNKIAVTLYTLLNGDANLDGQVAFNDYQLLEAGYGLPGTWATGDFNLDGMVTFADYQLLEVAYGTHVGGGGAKGGGAKLAPVPEPGTLGLLLMLALSAVGVGVVRGLKETTHRS